MDFLGKTHKGILPQFLMKRERFRKRALFLGTGLGAPVLVGIYNNTKEIQLIDTESLQLFTIVAEDDGEIQRVLGHSGYIVVEQDSSLTVAYMANGNKLSFKFHGHFWFFVQKNLLIVVDEHKLTKIHLKPGFTSAGEYQLNPPKTIAGRKFIPNPNLVHFDATSGNVAVAFGTRFQVWNLTHPAQSDVDGAPGSLVMEGHVEGQFGIVLIRVIDTHVCALTHSGELLEMWHTGQPKGHGEMPSHGSYVQIKQEKTATALHMDEEFVIVGHMDGSVTLYDRISGQKRVAIPEGTSHVEHGVLLSDARIIWLDRKDMYLFSGSAESIYVRRVDNPTVHLRHKYSSGCKLDQAYLDRLSGIVYALIQIDGDDNLSKKTDLVLWHPKLKDLNRKSLILGVEPGELVDLSPPIQLTAQRPLEEWNALDVVHFLASIKLHEWREPFFAAGLTGQQLAAIDDEKLKELGVTAVGQRKRIIARRNEILQSPDSVAEPEHTPEPAPSPDANITPPAAPAPAADSAAPPKRTRFRSNSKLPPLLPIADKPSSASTKPGKANKAPRIKLTFVCRVDNSEDSVSLRFLKKKQHLKDVVHRIDVALEAEGLKSPSDASQYFFTGPDGPVELTTQDQVNELITKSLTLKHPKVRLVVKLPTNSGTKTPKTARTASFTAARETLLSRPLPSLLVEDHTYNVITLNPAVQTALGYDSSELIGKPIDRTDLLVSPDFYLSHHVAEFDKVAHNEAADATHEPNTSARLEWSAVVQHKDGILAVHKLSMEDVQIDGARYFIVMLHSPDKL